MLFISNFNRLHIYFVSFVTFLHNCFRVHFINNLQLVYNKLLHKLTNQFAAGCGVPCTRFPITVCTRDVAQPYRKPLMPSETSQANAEADLVRLRYAGRMTS